MSKTRYEFLVDLMRMVEQYEVQHPDETPTVMDFTVWLNRQMLKDKPEAVIPESENEELEDMRERLALRGGFDMEITTLNGYMSRHLRYFSKNILRDHGLVSFEDYGYLRTLELQGPMSKTALIHSMMMEVASGTEILKRLLKNKLIDETKHETDKRAVLVSVNNKGRKLLESLTPQLNKVVQLAGAALTEKERITLVILMHRQHEYFQQAKEISSSISIDSIMERVESMNGD